MRQSEQRHPHRRASELPTGGSSGALHTIDAYQAAVYRIPMIEPDEQRELIGRLRAGEGAAAERLVFAHLRLVTSIARTYLSSGLPLADLIQEGNVGLMKAINGFDPEYGTQFASFAFPHIRAAIRDYILDNERMVRRITTKPLRKLYHNLHRYTVEGSSLRADQVAKVCEDLSVTAEDVREMEIRLRYVDVPMDMPSGSDATGPAPMDLLEDEGADPAVLVEVQDILSKRWAAVSQALESLDSRSRHIVDARWLGDPDENRPTLAALAADYGVSMERLRQIEKAALRKVASLVAEFH